MTKQSTWIRKGFSNATRFTFGAVLLVAITLTALRAWSMTSENARLLDQARWNAETELAQLQVAEQDRTIERFKAPVELTPAEFHQSEQNVAEINAFATESDQPATREPAIVKSADRSASVDDRTASAAQEIAR
jgi:hypothetical protein